MRCIVARCRSSASVSTLHSESLVRSSGLRHRSSICRHDSTTQQRQALLPNISNIERCPHRQIIRRGYTASSSTTSASLLQDGDDIKVEPPRELSVEEQYSRKTPIEHVLLRPGMYVGPVQRLPPEPCWVLDRIVPPPHLADPTSGKSDDRPQMVRREYSLYPALVKIFDEILVNASDNRLRHSSTTNIDVIIDPGHGDRPPFISIQNNGKGIPIQIHKTEHIYIPEMLFGHLLTGSNFDDDSTHKRVTGGRHGYGAKLTNIFSKSFTVETVNSKANNGRGLRYRQTWRDNMSIRDPAIIDKLLSNSVDDYTRVEFIPDLEKLTNGDAVTTIPMEDYAIMCRRVYDVAGCANGKLQVTLNGKVVPNMKGFQEYVHLYRKDLPICSERINPRWEVCVGLSDSGSFESTSFVNGLATTRGGTHVSVIVQQVTKQIMDQVLKLHPELEALVTPNMVRRNLFVAVNALIENPTFDSQMKEFLTSNPNSFGSQYTLSKKFLKQLVDGKSGSKEDNTTAGLGIVQEIIRVAKSRQRETLLKDVQMTRRQLLSIPKLEDAHFAGTDKGVNCTLILTEGDSAKALAVAGLEVIGRKQYGVFPLRGKLLNVRHASLPQLALNAEVKALCSILGLEFGKEYSALAERASLRYGHVMLMTDQDADGSHIKGLVMNLFRHFWPSLLKPPIDGVHARPFLSSFITPLLKATRKGGKKEVKSFSTIAEYMAWRASLSGENGIQNWRVKYYKGLGTSTPAEAKEYFRDFNNHHRPFRWSSEDDGQLLDMLFQKDRAEERREWINNEYDISSTTTVDANDKNSVSFSDFVNNEMIHFSNADNVRSLPSVVDGLKPSQRKVLYACFKRKLKNEIKVAQLSGYCAEHTAYHHGEASLHATITGMAQDFVGSNNINLLVPSGQFGTRMAGGKDGASPRYIFTYLSPMARLLFPEVDDALLNYKEDDGLTIEPEFFCPIIPLLVVNGSQGIGTGWSTFIPPHNPRDVLAYVRSKLDRTDPPPIKPWVRSFKGQIEMKEDGKGYTSVGTVKKLSSKSFLISELPVGRWTNNYKEFLLKLQSKREIQSFVENHTTTSVSFTVHVQSVHMSRMEKIGLPKVFKLIEHLPLTNMNAFDSKNVIQRFDSPEAIADSFFPIRLALYHERKFVLERYKEYSAKLMKSKARFIEAVKSGDIDLIRSQKTKADTVHILERLEFPRMSDLESIRSGREPKISVASDPDVTEQDNDDKGVVAKKEFDYLLNMPMSSLTTDRIEQLRMEALETEKELKKFQCTTPEDLWRQDLDVLEHNLQ